MKNIVALQDNHLCEDSRILLNEAKQKFGRIPNLLRCMAHSPRVLKAYLDFSKILDKSLLSKQIREQIAIAVAGAGDCEYCLSAHIAFSELLGLAQDEIAENIRGHSHDPKTARILKFAVEMVTTRGRVGDKALEGLRSIGLNEAEIAEIVAVVCFNIFSNYFNRTARPKLDYPAVDIGLHEMRLEINY